VIRSDNGSEYRSRGFNTLCEDFGITQQFTSRYTPEQNGAAERLNRTLIEMMRCLLAHSSAPPECWGDALMTACYLRNRCLTTGGDSKKTPLELFSGKVPHVHHLRVFGCRCYVHVPKATRHKLSDTAIPGIFMGYDLRSLCYRVYFPETKRYIVTRDVVAFDETTMPFAGQTSSQCVLEYLEQLLNQGSTENQITENYPSVPLPSEDVDIVASDSTVSSSLPSMTPVVTPRYPPGLSLPATTNLLSDSQVLAPSLSPSPPLSIPVPSPEATSRSTSSISPVSQPSSRLVVGSDAVSHTSDQNSKSEFCTPEGPCTVSQSRVSTISSQPQNRTRLSRRLPSSSVFENIGSKSCSSSHLALVNEYVSQLPASDTTSTKLLFNDLPFNISKSTEAMVANVLQASEGCATDGLLLPDDIMAYSAGCDHFIPQSYEEAMTCGDKDKWEQAIKLELSSLDCDITLYRTVCR
jgi:hypothetical protein